MHKARARRERNRDKLSHFSKKPLPSVVGKVAARQEPRVPIPCERTFGISRPFSRQMRHYDPASAAFSCLGGRKCA